MGVDNVGEQSLGDAEGQGVDNGLVVSASAGAGPRVAVGRDIEEVAKETGEENGGKDPSKCGGPEARSQQQEHVGEVNVVFTGTNGGNGRNGESKAIGENGGANVVKLESSDGEENAGNGAQSLTGSVGSLGDAALLVDGGDALTHSDGRTVNSEGNVCGGGRQGDARSNLGEAASGRAEDGARVDPIHSRVDLGSNLVGSFGNSALSNLEALVDFLLYSVLFLFNGRTESLGAAGEVASEVGVGREARCVLGNEVIEGDFEVALLVVLVAARG